MSRHLIRLPRHKWPKSWSSIEDPIILFWTESVWSSCDRILMGKAIGENPTAARLEKGLQLGMLVRTPSKNIILICVCGWHKIGWKETNLDPMLKLLNKRIRFRRVHIFPGSCVCLGCNPRQCQTSKDIVDNHRIMFESRIFAVGSEKNHHTPQIFVFLHGLMIWNVMQRNVWSDIASHQNKTFQQFYKTCTPCIDEHHFKEEENAVCWIIVTSNGRRRNLHDRPQKGPKLVTNAWIDWYHTFITHVNTNSFALWTTPQNNADCDSDCGRFWGFKIHFWGTLHFLTSYISSNNTVQQIRNHLFGRWIEIGRESCSRCVGSDCFCLWKHDSDSWKTGKTRCQWQKSKISKNDQRDGECWFYSFKRTVFALRNFAACVWEDNEAVIKMVIRGRSPTMRHVSRTHRVALDW